MNRWATLKYAGSKPYQAEAERLPYPVFEMLSQDDEYTDLALLRYFAGKIHDDAAAEVEDTVIDSYDAASEAVDEYVAVWVKTYICDIDHLDGEHVTAAREEYGVER